MAAEGDILRYVFTGEDGEVIPRNATHVTVDESVKVIPRRAFYQHPNIIEVNCHDGVDKIEGQAFYRCPSLRLVRMPGVKIVEGMAFFCCVALSDIEFGELERIGHDAFAACTSLRSVNLPSVKIVGEAAFCDCGALTDVRFGDKLERIEGWAFLSCTSLGRIAIPLKDRITNDRIFTGCENLNHVDLVGGVHETVAALGKDEWKNDVNAEIDRINQILPNTPGGRYYGDDDYDVGGKARAIKTWIRSVFRKIVRYKQQHRNLLTEVTTILVEELALPRDIVIKHVISFLELPSWNWNDD